MTHSADTKHLMKHLEDVHAIELALVQTLTAHIGVTPESEYRALLERHLGETNTQAQRLRDRLVELGVGTDPIALVRGAVETVVGQAIAAAKAPVDLLRGPSGEEKLLRNARDEVASEALEIAAYDALEAIAEAAGDEKTAVLAREHRTQEEIMLRDLREQIPALARAAHAAETSGDGSYDLSTTGAVQAARSATGRLAGRARHSAAAPPDAIAAMPVDRALRAIDAIDDGEELARVEAAERQGRGRVRVLARLRARREQVAGVGA